MKKKVISREMKKIKQANYSIGEFLEHLKENYTFLTAEEKQINNIQTHLINMNVLFTDLEKGMKND